MAEQTKLLSVLRHPFFWVVLVLASIALAWILIPPGASEADQINAFKLVQAIEAYKTSLKNDGKEIPVEMGLQELVRVGLLTSEDLGMFAELKSSVFLRPTNTPAVLMRAALPNGETFYLLDDGSVEWLSADQAL